VHSSLPAVEGSNAYLSPGEAHHLHQQANQARRDAIQRAAEIIRGQCQAAGGGDWDQWQRDTDPYRLALVERLNALKTFDPPRSQFPEGRYEVLAGRRGFPLFEVGAREHLNYLYDPASLDAIRREKPVLAVHRWLRQRGIDLIFVPVPKMTEVYIEQFLDPCPPDGIIAPHIRRCLLELLEAGVEVVDAVPLFRNLRYSDAEFLYNAADTHWAPRGMRVMAKEIADRIARYDFGARARYAPPVVRTKSGAYMLDLRPGGIGSRGGWAALNKQQRKRATAVQPTTQVQLTLADGNVLRDDLRSPVLVLGNSYAVDFREQLIREMNLLIRRQGSATNEGFADLLRDPDLLNHCRVVVWITTEQHLTHFKPLPPAIAALATGVGEHSWLR
jgi:hypothetical protein